LIIKVIYGVFSKNIFVAITAKENIFFALAYQDNLHYFLKNSKGWV
jgi:hypothetical protein